MSQKINTYWEYKTEETHRKGSRLLLIGFFLFIFWAVNETLQEFFLPLFLFRVSLISICLSAFLALRYFGKKNEQWVIPIYTIAVNLILLNDILVCVLVNTSTSIPVEFTTNHPVGLVCFLMVLTSAALGARVYCKYTFPILILTYCTYAYISGIDDTQHLILLGMVTIFLAYQMNIREKHQKRYFYSFTNTIERQESKLIKANKQLNDANTKLKEINFALSHDLKTPIRNIISFSQILKRTTNDKLDDDEKEYLKHIIQSTNHIHDLVEDIFIFFNTYHNKDHAPNIVDLDKVFSNLKNNYRSLEHEQQLSLSFQKKPPKIKGNYTKIYLLLQNIIDNGIKYNNSAIKEITVRHFQLNDKTYIKIKDNGIGIEEAYQADIFKPFKRLHSREVYQGSGIGLALCAEIVKQLGGQITLTSTVNEGSEFVLEFPSPES